MVLYEQNLTQAQTQNLSNDSRTKKTQNGNKQNNPKQQCKNECVRKKKSFFDDI